MEEPEPNRREFLGRVLSGGQNTNNSPERDGWGSLGKAIALVSGMYLGMRIIMALNRSEQAYKTGLIAETLEFAKSNLGMSVENLICFSEDIVPGLYSVEAIEKDTLEGRALVDVHRYEDCAENTVRFFLKRGYDAFMTREVLLGDENTPLTKELLESDSEEIVYVLLRMAFYRHMRENNIEVPRNYEEQIARYFGLKGAIEFYENRDQELENRAEAQLKRHLSQAEFIIRYHRELTDCYAKGGRRGRILRRAQKEWLRLVGELVSGSRFLYKVNNAFLYHNRQWALHFDDVVDVLGRSPLQEYLSSPHRMHKLLAEKISGKPAY